MLKFAANLTMLYTDVPFLERFGRARASGFDAVEFLFPYSDGLDAVTTVAREAAVTIALFNLPAGDWEHGERGIAILPDRRAEFRAGVAEAIRYATALGVQRLNCLAGRRPGDLPEVEAWAVLRDNVRYAADELAKAHLTLMLEPINPYDIPGFFLNRTSEVIDLIREVGRSNIQIQYDIYHLQRTQGEIIGTFRTLREHIGHIQIADNPGRHQPGTGELNYKRIFSALDEAGYTGYIGLEYIPQGRTEDSLEWWRLYQNGQFAG
ncbi:hydroxypyruvate isomerase [Sulfobacillus thermosulfidooxidans]|uniref:hydroxypyruvate isomerase n=1 Tax=Sulfobacillus thermosulfidooxidans TaxID=28034 RepID=UPI00096B7B7F|nr:hydroxypyruvate isomerase [Sulfobacillus thermosulfidooxidans]OLZ08759.1 hydroxypyruvate isomerase [Sulfobacillus thermosulfidooxidans]OLZ14821.1 hydroxypyruvate isomerase [Sulfobacillus thermosulfidooxidans]OLZ22035.1 hydroxypyruvate isomerase [Sulfobacillus thermosulfidooxidans]